MMMRGMKMVAVQKRKGNSPMYKSLNVVLFVLLCAFIFVGCGVSWNSRQVPCSVSPSSYEVGAVYELCQDVFVGASVCKVGNKIGYLTPPQKHVDFRFLKKKQCGNTELIR